VATTKLTIREYLTADGDNPFRAWLAGLDSSVRARLQARVLRFETGNLGDHRAVGLGVWEARCDFGPGYRIYFAKVRTTIVLLLLGGDKSSQRADIRRAQQYWADYQEATHRGTSK
jgi:putative addiction module killer protein